MNISTPCFDCGRPIKSYAPTDNLGPLRCGHCGHTPTAHPVHDPDPTRRYHCTECGDTMHPSFRWTHDLICSLLSLIIEQDIDEFLDEIARET